MVLRVVWVSVVMVCLLKYFKGEFFEVVAGHTNIVTPGLVATHPAPESRFPDFGHFAFAFTV
jgi:hypothetical protein